MLIFQQKLLRLFFGGVIINDLRDGYIRVNNDIVLKTMENEINDNKDGVQRLELRVYLALASHSTLCGNHKEIIKALGIKEYNEGGKQYPYLYCYRNVRYVVDLIRDDLHIGLTDRDINKRNCEIELCLLKLQRDGFIFATEDRYYIPIYNKYTQIPVDVYEKMLEYFKLNKDSVKSPGRNYYAWAIVAIFKHLYFSETGRVGTCFLGDKTSNGITETQFLTSQEKLWENIDEVLHYVGLDHVNEPSSAEGVFFTKQHFGFLGSEELSAIRKKVQETAGSWQGPYDGYYKSASPEQGEGVAKKTENSVPPAKNAPVVDSWGPRDTLTINDFAEEVEEIKFDLTEAAERAVAERNASDCDMALVNDVVDEFFNEPAPQPQKTTIIDEVNYQSGPVRIDDYQLTEAEQAWFDSVYGTRIEGNPDWEEDTLCSLRRKKKESAAKRGIELIIDVPLYSKAQLEIMGNTDESLKKKYEEKLKQEEEDREEKKLEQERKRREDAKKVINFLNT